MFARHSQRALRTATPPPFRLCPACRRLNSSTTTPASENDSQRKRRIIFSGIQPTGVPHLGNYLGALRQWVQLQNNAGPDDKQFFSIVDLHAITVKQDREQLVKWRKEMFASLLAVGLDPKKSSIFLQSDVPQHAELMWILSCNASMGYLGRMTQWKSKLALPENASPLDPSPSHKAALKLGLFSYPVLQAADIILYGATHVPVGEDQAQHLEFAREVAIGFNHAYPLDGKPVLTPPETILAPAKRVMSLTNPTKKMSKSDTDPKSRILITDSKEKIYKKVKSALTDSIDGISYDRERRPGVSNLIDILYYMNEDKAESPEQLARDMLGPNLSMRALKVKVTDAVDEKLEDVRDRYGYYVRAGEQHLESISKEGATHAMLTATRQLRLVKRAMGLSWS